MEEFPRYWTVNGVCLPCVVVQLDIRPDGEQCGTLTFGRVQHPPVKSIRKIKPYCETIIHHVLFADQLFIQVHFVQAQLNTGCLPPL